MVASKPLVLVVDDTDELRELLEESVSSLGFPVASARDGADALKMLPSVRAGIVLLDMNMPAVDGLEFLKRFRGVIGAQALPVVIAMSADQRFRSISKERGAFDFLEKPIDASVLEVVLAEATEGRMIGPEPRARHRERIRERYIEDDARRDELLRHSRIGAPAFRRELVSMLRWLSGYFDLPMALVNLLKSGRLELFETYGTPAGYTAGAEMRAEDTYCVDLIRSSESLVLRDTRAHPLYRDHPVTKLGVGFYVSVPLRTRAGFSLGTLCLESTRPVSSSNFRTEDLILLRYFADLVGEQARRSVTDPEATPGVFPNPNLLDRGAFRALFVSRIAPSSPEAFPFALATLKGSNADFVVRAGRAFDRLASRQRLAIGRRHDLPLTTVDFIGAPEGLAAMTSALESEELRYTSNSRTIDTAVESGALTEVFGTL